VNKAPTEGSVKIRDGGSGADCSGVGNSTRASKDSEPAYVNRRCEVTAFNT